MEKPIKINENRVRYKDIILAHVNVAQYGSFLSDDEARRLAVVNDLKLSDRQIQDVIRSCEKLFEKRLLVRQRNLGWVILTPREHFRYAHDQGRKKMKKTIRRTSQRLGNVEENQLEYSEKEQINNLKRSYAALGSIIKQIEKPKLTHNHVKELNSTAISLEVLNKIVKKNAGKG